MGAEEVGVQDYKLKVKAESFKHVKTLKWCKI